MEKEKRWGDILFWATLVSPMVSFSLAAQIGEPEIFSTAGIVRYSWIMWLFIPIGVLSMLIGKRLKKNNQKYKKNFIIAYICLPLLIIFGSYAFIFSDAVSSNASKLNAIEQETGFTMPDDIKIATSKYDSLYELSYVKILDNEERKLFEDEIESSDLWQTELIPAVQVLLPFSVQVELGAFEYFMFYDITNDEYNLGPSNKESEWIFIAYDCEAHRLIIFDNYQASHK
jgi:hypothetical protein